jgi:YegS/Rv2252/BmrU family lipid kinase
MAAPVCLIVNPAAGGGKAGRVAPDAERALARRGLAVRRADTRDLAHARELAAEAAARGETVAALSGDGMVGAIADVLRDTPAALLAILPGGRGNDLARVLGIPDDIDAACAIVADGVPVAMDLGEVLSGDGATSGPAFVGIASAGFDSDANRIANEAPALLGGLVYAYGALRALLAWRPSRFEIELLPSGERHAFTGYSVGAANSQAYGGGMFAAPDARLDDGQLDVVVCEDISKLGFLTRMLPRVFKGTHVQLPSVHVFRSEEVVISSDRPFTMYADGDPIGELPLRVRARRGAVTVLVPVGASPRGAFAGQATPPVAVGESAPAQPLAPAAPTSEPPTAR